MPVIMPDSIEFNVSYHLGRVCFALHRSRWYAVSSALLFGALLWVCCGLDNVSGLWTPDPGERPPNRQSGGLPAPEFWDVSIWMCLESASSLLSEAAIIEIESDPSFDPPDWHNVNGLACRSASKSHAGQHFKGMGREAGLPEAVVNGLSGYSARVGGAQDMIADGIELPVILQVSRWKSTATVNRYREQLLARRSGVAQLARLQNRA